MFLRRLALVNLRSHVALKKWELQQSEYSIYNKKEVELKGSLQEDLKIDEGNFVFFQR